MENRHQQILSEIKSLMASVRVQLEQLDVKMAELQQSFEPQSIVIEPTDFSIDDIPSVEGLASLQDISTVIEIGPMVSEPETVIPEPEPLVSEPVAEVVQESVTEQAIPELPVQEEATEIAAEQPIIADNAVSGQTVIDVMTSRQAWRTDMPGTPVKDVRAAIALVDRALFINTLFGEDAASFINAVNAVNQMTSLDEVVEYITETHSDWDMESDIVYRFMMAVRRKVN